MQNQQFKSDEVLIETISLSVNPVDYKVRSNDGALNWILGADRPAIIGWDLSGTIIEVGEAVTDFKIETKTLFLLIENRFIS